MTVEGGGSKEKQTIKYSKELLFYVNGKRISLKQVDPQLTLLTFLREELSLTGPKLCCGEGGCGACTVVLSHWDQQKKSIRHRSCNACITRLCSVHGHSVTTIEGLGSLGDSMHPLQKSMAEHQGVQCGFCTPGMIMATHALTLSNPQATEADVENGLDGNLCRCTGYRPILDVTKEYVKAFQDLSKARETAEAKAEKLVEQGKLSESERSSLFDVEDMCASLENPVLQFPQELKTRVMKPLRLSMPAAEENSDSDSDSDVEPTSALEEQKKKKWKVNSVWYRPLTLESVLEIKRSEPEATFIVGNTDLGTEYKDHQFKALISLADVTELRNITTDENGFSIGGAVTLTEVSEAMQGLIAQYPAHQTEACRALVEKLRYFAGTQVRNMGCLAANLVSGSPTSDLAPIVQAANAVGSFVEPDGSTWDLPFTAFYKGYKKLAMGKDSLLARVFFPWTREGEYIRSYKQCRRMAEDIAIVTSGFRVKIDPETLRVEELAVCYGGASTYTSLGSLTAEALVGQTWSRNLIEPAFAALRKDYVVPVGSRPSGQIEFRRSLVLSFFFKFFLEVSAAAGAEVSAREASVLAPQGLDRPLHSAKQTLNTPKLPDGPHPGPLTTGKLWEEKLPGELGAQPTEGSALHQPVRHQNGYQLATGEALFTDDVAARRYPDALHAALVLSKHAHARITAIGTARALALDGVLGVYTGHDVPGRNFTGPMGPDEPILVTDEVMCHGQIIAVVVASTLAAATHAAKLVDVQYEVLTPILTVEEAIEKKAFFPREFHMERGDLEATLRNSAHVVEGSVRLGGQEQFYLEPQTALAIPGEGEEMEVLSSCQGASYVQESVAAMLNVSSAKIRCRVRRMGGGFGGKESRPAWYACAVALAASKLHRPVRIAVEREVDMITAAGRHPFVAKYRAGCDAEGKITALDLDMYCSGGHTQDLSYPVIIRAMLTCDNAYDLPVLRAHGRVCQTNLHSFTACRGFGAPQGIFIAESWLTHLAEASGIPPHRIREQSMYPVEGGHTHHNQPLPLCNVRPCYDEVKKTSEYEKRLETVADFNAKNRFRKRGLAIMAVKYGVSFTTLLLNQGAALVHVYMDGTVQAVIGGTEMGQGLFTKMAQIVANEFGIPVDKVNVPETNTDKIPNMVSTAASMSADIYGMAIIDACSKIRQRMDRVKATMPNTPTFEEVATMCFLQRVSLSDTGFFAYKEGMGQYDFQNETGTPFNYYSYGAAVAEVEVDTLTGDHWTVRADVLMDVGRSLNPALDIGQVEGAFVQGMGLHTTEELRYDSKRGSLKTQNTSTYKIPAVCTVPHDFRVTLLKDQNNLRAVHSSKGVGEPPLTLSTVVYLALKDAVRAARAENGVLGPFQMNAPATCEVLRNLCADRIAELCALDEQEQKHPPATFVC